MLAAAGAGEASGKGEEKQQQAAKKSVRMADDVPDGACTNHLLCFQSKLQYAKWRWIQR